MKAFGMWIGLLIIGICLVAGCTSPAQDEATNQSSADTSDVSSTPTSSAPGKAVDYGSLIPYLPNAPTGWIADEPTGGTMTTQDGSWSTASIEYTKAADENVNAMVIIQDSAHNQVGGWEMWGSFTSIETSDGYFRSSTVAGYPAWETYSKPDSYVAWVGINERFMVSVSIDGGTKSDLDTFVNLIDYNGIARLA